MRASPDEYIEVTCVECDVVLMDWACNAQESRSARRDRAIAVEAWHEEHGCGPHLCNECDTDDDDTGEILALDWAMFDYYQARR